MECKFCNRSCQNNNSLAQHQIRCKNNPDKIAVLPSRGMLGKRGSNQYIKAARNGESIVVADSTRQKLSHAASLQIWNDDRKRNHSIAMIEAVRNNPASYTAENVSGRTKLYEINGTKVKGTWELLVAEELNSNGIKWTNIIKGFPYEWESKIRTYYPDFYLPEHDTYIEVKGYERDRDRAKWNNFPEKLKVITKEHIEQIKKKKFNILFFINS